MSDTPRLGRQAPAPVPHNHWRKLLALIASAAIPVDTGLHQVTVAHDDWCGIFAGLCCNCDPDIRLAWSQPDAARN